MTRERLREIIFGSEDAAGKAFDVALIIAIIVSIAAVMLESVESIEAKYGSFLFGLEIVMTALFTIEYCLRIYVVERPWKYIFSTFGVIDFVSILPTFLSIVVPGAQVMLTVRGLRVLRVFRVLKIANLLSEADYLSRALHASKRKVSVFLLFICLAIVIAGSIIYFVEGKENGFDNIFVGCYWAAITVTTLGYGDVTAITPIGKALSALLAVVGFALISVPGGILTVSFVQMEKDKISTEACPGCGQNGHSSDAVYCKYCGEEL